MRSSRMVSISKEEVASYQWDWSGSGGATGVRRSWAILLIGMRFLRRTSDQPAPGSGQMACHGLLWCGWHRIRGQAELATVLAFSFPVHKGVLPSCDRTY